jgi:spore maturation protein CgeB
MNFAFFGSSLVSAYWNGAATYYRGLIRALAARGHSVTFYEPDAYGRQQHRDIDDPAWARVVVYAATVEAMERCLAEARRTADVVVKCSGVGVLDAELEAAVANLSGPSRIFWDVDAPATLEAIAAAPDDPMRTHVPRFDAICTYGGGEAVVSAYLSLGARLCVPVYNAVDPETHHPVAPDPRFAADLGFLGNRLPDREARVEAFFLSAAERLPAATFLLGGSGWEDKAMPANVRHVGHVFTRDHNAFNVTPTAVLNINRASMARFGASPPTRIFEAAGAGAAILSDRWTGVEAFLEPGREILLADDGADVAAHVEALTPARARELGEAARRRILAHHTYALRALQVEALLEGRDGWRKAS